ncbi:MAG: amidohydrolase family protein [Pirellulales bacterium]|nr:amidohydrolase family protein [Pirellulales bacterium]
MKQVRLTARILLAATAMVWTSLVSDLSADSFAIRARRILPVAPDLPEVIEPGVLVVRDNRIAMIGSDIEVPLDLPVIDYPDGTLIPGLVAAVSDLGGNHPGDESIAAGYRAADTFDRYGNYAKFLAAGVTTVHINPGSHRLLTGQGAVVRLGGPAADRILRPAADLTINLGPDVYYPPQDVTYSFPASADVEIVPGRLQRPSSRMGQILGLEESIRDALAGKNFPEFSLHPPALAHAWNEKLPLRLRADRTGDLLAAIHFLREHERQGYLVGGAEADQVADPLRQANVPLVYQLPGRFRSPGSNIGRDPEAYGESILDFRKLDGVEIALAPSEAGSIGDLRLVAIRACGAGLDRARALAAITRGPARILGIADCVGSLAPGMDADFVVLSGDPLDLSAHVQRTYIRGCSVFEAPDQGPLIVKAGTIWAGPGMEWHDAQVLIEGGKIVDVGRSVPHPPFARVIDAGPNAFVMPGWIDSHSHLGLDGDKSQIGNEIRISQLIGVPDVTDLRVCRAGITTVLMAPYLGSGAGESTRTAMIVGGRIVLMTRPASPSGSAAPMGAPAAAVKTAGPRRKDRVIRDPAAVLLDVSQADPLSVQEMLAKPIDAGQKYLDSWTKYEKELKEFLEKKKDSKAATEDTKPVQEETKEMVQPDPITGTWEAVVTGGPLPAPVTLTLVMQLIGTNIEGRITHSSMGFTGRLHGTLTGNHISAVFEIDIPDITTPPQLEADLVAEDHCKGTVAVMGLSLPIEGRRVDKKPVELKVTQTRRTRTKDGRPLPPKVNEALEPLKNLLEKKIPAVVKVSTPAQIREVLDLFVDKHDLPLVLLDADGAAVHAERLAEKKVTVIVPPAVLQQRQYRDYHLADTLARQRVPIAFQSNAEDAARNLPAIVMYAVERGLDAEDALTALTAGAAKAMKIDDRVGTLEPGKDGDLVIFSSHPLQGPSRILRVIVCGEEVQP